MSNLAQPYLYKRQHKLKQKSNLVHPVIDVKFSIACYGCKIEHSLTKLSENTFVTDVEFSIALPE